MECQGGVVSILITPINHIISPVIVILNLLSKSSRPPSRVQGFWGLQSEDHNRLTPGLGSIIVVNIIY